MPIYIDTYDLTAYTYNASGHLVQQPLTANNSFDLDTAAWEPIDPSLDENFINAVKAILDDSREAVDPNDL